MTEVLVNEWPKNRKRSFKPLLSFNNRRFRPKTATLIWTKRKIQSAATDYVMSSITQTAITELSLSLFQINSAIRMKILTASSSNDLNKQAYSVPMNIIAIWFVQKKSPIQWLTLLRKPSTSTEKNKDLRRQIPFCNRWPLQTPIVISIGFYIICIYDSCGHSRLCTNYCI